MNEIVLSNKKNGMAVLLITILMYLLAIAACIFGSFIIDSPLGIILLVISIIWRKGGAGLVFLVEYHS